MEEHFYKQRIISDFDIDVIIPNETDRQLIHDIIYQELCLGVVSDTSRQQYLLIIQQLHQQRVQTMILGCTEIGLLIKRAYTQLPSYDTTTLHIESAIKMPLDME